MNRLSRKLNAVRWAVAIAVLALVSKFAIGATYFVPQDFPTIQAAINFASGGDSVIIQSGTYNERIDTLGKDISISGVGANPPTIDGTGLAAPLIRVRPASDRVFMSNLVVRNGDGILGGALQVDSGGDLLMINMEFRDNRAISGGAVAINFNADVEIRDSGFFGNQASSDGGALLVLNGSDVLITNTNIGVNDAGDDGGAISAVGSTVEIISASPPAVRNQITGNDAGRHGGAIMAEGGAVVSIDGYYMPNNEAGVNGGGAAVIGSTYRNVGVQYDNCKAVGSGGAIDGRDGSTLDIRQGFLRACEAQSGGGINLFEADLVMNETTLIGNIASGFGGGLMVLSVDNRAEALVDTTRFIVNEADFGAGARVTSSGPAGSTPQAAALFSNCEFWTNTATASFGSGGLSAFEFAGGGVQTIVEVINCTLTRNRGGSANGISGTGGPRFDIENTIIWDNNGPGIVGDPTRITTRHSIFPEIATFVGTGNFFADPMFVRTDISDLSLLPGSPAIDAGRNASVAPDLTDRDEDGDIFEPTPLDADRFTRISDDPLTPDTGSGSGAIVDIGANEFPRVCEADLNPPYGGSPSFFDLSAFINLFSAGDPLADIAAPFGVLNFFDVSAYIALFNTPCP